MRYRHSLAIIAISVLRVLPAFAQAQPAPSQTPPVRFDTDVQVTAERGETPRSQVPAATFVLDGETLPTLPSVFLGETLSFVPGFHVERGEFHAGRPVVSARGFFGGGEAEYILLLVDGVPIADAESGLIDWALVPASSVRRIEAFRGPGASMYGDSAVGGVIQGPTNRSRQHAQLAATGGSFNTVAADGAFGRRLAKVGAEISGSARRTDGFAQHSSARHVVGNGALDGPLGSATWRWSGGGNRRFGEDPGALTLEALGLDPTVSDPMFRFDEQDRHGVSTSFDIQHTASRWGRQARLYANHRNEDLIRTIPLAPELGDRQARTLSTFAIGGSAEAERTLGRAERGGVVRFGTDLSREHLDNAYAPVGADGVIGPFDPEVSGHRFRGAVFVSSAWDPAPRVRVSGAVRWDHVDDEGFGTGGLAGGTHEAWSPRVGATVRLSDAGEVSLFSQVSNAFKVPSLDQLFDPRPYPDFQGGTFTISNQALVPQRATNYEAGISGKSAALRWSALAYRMDVDNEIDFDARTFTYANIGQSRHTGVELEASGGAPSRRVQPSIAYALTRVLDVERGGGQLKNIPRHRITLAANVVLPAGLSAYVRYRHASRSFLDDENTLAIEGPSALDLRLRRVFGRHAVFVDAINLTDDHYEEYGFTLTDFGGNVVPYAYPGALRAIRAGLTLAF